MYRDVRGRRLLITGASSGIGRSLAELAALEGALGGVAAASAHKLSERGGTLKSRGGDVLAVPADVTSDGDRRRLLQAVENQFGGLDVLVNNAGVASFGHFADSSEEVLRRVMELNFFAPAELMRQAVPVLARGKDPAIVNVSSMCGRRGIPAWPEYSASKFALSGLSDALRAELVRFGVEVLLVVPGLTGSDLGTNLLRNAGRMKIDFSEGQPPERVAEGILRALRRGTRETVVGWDARWILRVNRFFPRLVDRLLARRVR